MSNKVKSLTIGGIETSDITVIIQGAFDKNTTPNSVSMLRSVLPGSTLILSTWENTSIDEDTKLNLDEIVLSKDPGAVLSDEVNRIFYNYNRQIVSTQNGLAKAKTAYALKIRSDMIIEGTKFLEAFSLYPQRDANYKVLDHRLVVTSMFTRHKYIDEIQEYNAPVLHVSDWVFFGTLNDLKTFFNQAELIIDPEFYTFFKKPNFKNVPRCYSTMTCRFPPEQQLAISSFKNFFPALNELNNYAEKNEGLVELSKNIILHNFIVLDPGSWPLIVNKPDYIKRSRDISKFSLLEFKTLYREELFNQDYRAFANQKFNKIDKVLVKHWMRPKIWVSFLAWKGNCFQESRLFFFHFKQMFKYLILVIRGIFHV